MDGVRSLAERIADSGYSVLLHDRRNCGASDVVIGGDESEQEIWADDLHALLQQLGAGPAFIGGASAGCRVSLLFALRHPEAVRGLLLWWVTGGQFAADRLGENYYGQFIAAAEAGGMAAVCESEFFSARIAQNASNRDRLMAMEPGEFIAVMARWREFFIVGAKLPVIGATEKQLRSIAVPTCIVPGNDATHPRSVGDNLHTLIAGSELHHLDPPTATIESLSAAELVAMREQRLVDLTEIYVSYLERTTAAVSA
jgi:pimeloyl-ACP methyl ester carboxylesterase